jgi:hypothetical protein
MAMAIAVASRFTNFVLARRRRIVKKFDVAAAISVAETII